MKRKKNNKMIVIAIIIIFIVLLAFSAIMNHSSIKEISFIKDITVVIEKAINLPFTTKPIDQSKSYLIEKNRNEALEKDIAELKEQLELNRTLTEYKPINATILSRNKSYWLNTITIDKGKSSGIKKDMIVVTSKGLIGKVNKVSNLSSEIKLITSDDINYKTSVAITTNGVDSYAILNGYKQGLIIVSGIDKTTAINVGDIVKTSGLGGVTPSGIYVGKVEKIETDKYNLSKTLYIKTEQDFNKIHYVTVLGEKE